MPINKNPKIKYELTTAEEIKKNPVLQMQIKTVDTLAFLEKDNKNDKNIKMNFKDLPLYSLAINKTKDINSIKTNKALKGRYKNAMKQISTYSIPPKANVFLAIDSSTKQCVGYISVADRYVYATIDRLAVSPTHQGMGIGRNLIKKGLQFALFEKKFDQVRVESRSTAIGFYEKHLFSSSSKNCKTSLSTKDYEKIKEELFTNLAKTFKAKLSQDDSQLIEKTSKSNPNEEIDEKIENNNSDVKKQRKFTI